MRSNQLGCRSRVCAINAARLTHHHPAIYATNKLNFSGVFLNIPKAYNRIHTMILFKKVVTQKAVMVFLLDSILAFRSILPSSGSTLTQPFCLNQVRTLSVLSSSNLSSMASCLSVKIKYSWMTALCSREPPTRSRIENWPETTECHSRSPIAGSFLTEPSLVPPFLSQRNHYVHNLCHLSRSQVALPWYLDQAMVFRSPQSSHQQHQRKVYLHPSSETTPIKIPADTRKKFVQT